MSRKLPLVALAAALVIALFFPGDAAASSPPATVKPTSTIVPIGGLRASGATLTDAASASDTVIYVTDHERFRIGQRVELQNREIMEVAGLTDGVYSSTGGATLSQNINASQTSFNVSTAVNISIGQTIQVSKFDFILLQDVVEQMLVTGKAGNTLTVVRGRTGTTPNTFNSVTSVLAGPGETMTVLRAQLGTVAESQPLGTAVNAEYTYVNVTAAAVPELQTGATVSQTIDATLFESSGAKLTEDVTAANTTFKVSNAAQLFVNRIIQIGSEKLKITDSKRGFQFAAGSLQDTGVDLAQALAAPDPVTCTLTSCGTAEEVLITNYLPLKVGWVILVSDLADEEGEQMLIVGLSGDGPGGGQDKMKVVRGVNGVAFAHPTGNIFGGDDRITVLRAQQGTSAALHTTSDDILIDLRMLKVSDSALLTSGSRLRIDLEQVRISDPLPLYMHGTGVSLSAGINDSSTILPLNGTAPIEPGWIVKVDSERMAVHSVTRGCTVQSGAVTQEAMAASPQGTQEVIDVNDKTKFNSSEMPCTITIGTEKLLAQLVEGDGPCAAGQNCSGSGGPNPGVQDTMTVIRGVHDTATTTHSPNSAVASAGHVMRVTRGLHATPKTSHNAVAISALYSDPVTVQIERALGGTSAAMHQPPAAITDIDGLGGFDLTISFTAPSTGSTLTFAVNDVTSILPVTNGASFQVGWTILVDSERMKVSSIAGNDLTVQRGRDGSVAAPHVFASPVHGPVAADFTAANIGSFLGLTGRTTSCEPAEKALQSLTFLCTSQGTSLLGPTGSGTLASIYVSPRATFANAAPKTMTLSGVTLTDGSGDQIPITLATAVIQMMKCPDFDNDRRATLSDVNKIKKAIFGVEPPVPDEDVDLDTRYTIADLNSTLKMYFVGQPTPLRCFP